MIQSGNGAVDKCHAEEHIVGTGFLFKGLWQMETSFNKGTELMTMAILMVMFN